MITPVILSGGAGSRLWPLSRSFYPKQLQPLVDQSKTLLQQTALRCAKPEQFSTPIVVCNHEHRFLVGEQLTSVGVENATIILEPVARNTAPAIALAALRLAESNPQGLMLVMPADHLIRDVEAFLSATENAISAAQEGAIVTFGIVPTHAETAYGYIQSEENGPSEIKKVVSFTEKPDQLVAKQYLQAGNYYWNGGLFLMTAATYLQELAKFAPAILEAAAAAMANPSEDLDFLRINDEAFAASPSDSIDYAVMEHTNHAKMVPLDAGWNDVGSWSSLWEVLPKDDHGNATQGEVVAADTRNSTIISQGRLVATLGVQDLVVVETPDAVMVSHQKDSQKVKQLVKQLDQVGSAHSEHHRKVYRPWGWYDSIDAGEGFQVKRIQVKPGARLSTQRHNHRAEHWVVIKGQAEILNGEVSLILEENQSTYIPIGTKHALHNPSADKILEIIEVQTGAYLAEDDIERFEDVYGRVELPKTD